MQVEPRKVHVLGPRRAVKKRQHAGNFIDMLGIQTAAVVVRVKAFQATVLKAPDHLIIVVK